MLVDFCLPVHNEEKIVAASLKELTDFLRQQSGWSWRITIANNGSSDQTAAQASRFLSENVRLIDISSLGKGVAVKSAWLQSEADVLAYMDIDLAVALRHIPQLIAPIAAGEAELVIGSRLLPGSLISRSWVRELSSRSCNRLFRLLFGYPVSDTKCGFKAVRADFFRTIVNFLNDQQWFFDTELIVQTIIHRGQLLEIPVEWQEARYDRRKSKVRLWRDARRHFFNLLRLRQDLKKTKMI